MDKQQADKLIVEYLPKIYGFAMKKAFSYQEAEELSSDIVTEVYLSFLSAKEIVNLDGYVWRISEHVYAKFVSSKKKRAGISLDGMDIPDDTPIWDEDSQSELDTLRREIAFLTQMRRRIVYSFYYENKPISSIAKETGIPEGTVKWHLNKARNDLKEGFTMERKIGKLGIKPIKATSLGHSGNPGSNGGPEHYLRNKLNLNIVYSVYHEPRTLAEIAEELGVTPVYIEDTVKELEANGFLVPKAGGATPPTCTSTPKPIRQRGRINSGKSRWRSRKCWFVSMYRRCAPPLPTCRTSTSPAGIGSYSRPPRYSMPLRISARSTLKQTSHRIISRPWRAAILLPTWR